MEGRGKECREGWKEGERDGRREWREEGRRKVAEGIRRGRMLGLWERERNGGKEGRDKNGGIGD